MNVNYIFLFPAPTANYQDNWRCISNIRGDGSAFVPSPPPSLSGPAPPTGASSTFMLSGTHHKDKNWYVYNIESLYCYTIYCRMKELGDL